MLKIKESDITNIIIVFVQQVDLTIKDLQYQQLTIVTIKNSQML